MTPVHRLNSIPTACTAFSGLRTFLAGSPVHLRRIVFVILRTGRSPSVALHPASRQRSYGRLQAGDGLPEEDFHFSDMICLQAH